MAGALAFYQQELPALGWQLQGEPVVIETMALATFTQGDQPLTLIITPGEAGSKVRLLPDEVLLGELEVYTYRKTTTGTYYTAPPGRHDDTVMALALAWWLATSPRLTLGIAEV